MTLQTNNPLLLRDFSVKDAAAATLTFPKPQPSPAVEGAAGYSQSPPPFPLSRALVSYYSRSDAAAIADHAGTTRLPPPPRARASPSVHANAEFLSRSCRRRAPLFRSSCCPWVYFSVIVNLDPIVREAFDVAYDNINAFHAAQRIPEKEIENMKGVRCKRIARCIASVGLYVPGGTAVLPSTALMLSVPAQIAGCKTIVLATPPGRDGSICKEVLYCAKKAGVTHILKAGGAQAISAMAWGTSSCPKVEKIFGPGNQYVTAAKMILQNSEAMVSIDMPAGPSEVLVIADRHANPIHIAADLLSQAEHGPDSQVVLVIAGDGVNVDAILAEVSKQCDSLPRGEFASKALGHSFVKLLKILKQRVMLRPFALYDLESFEFLLQIVIWYNLLRAINIVSKFIQSKDMDVDIALNLLQGLDRFLDEFREEGFASSMNEPIQMASEVGIEPKF
ncbi:histidinol dehydrogenase, chloroplastic-like [Zingiber officinale]|uniref:histidinol dehydrogenase, chloroplastic-like n=1 Tax=Zingiber officinale TaxID=94328 RepID=UPI001C4ACCFC|nr:histidinol dehydrogenase, chloroplastic-like [Zingiber officinale]